MTLLVIATLGVILWGPDAWRALVARIKPRREVRKINKLEDLLKELEK